MFQNLDLFKLSGAMARHAGQRLATSAANLANADTPGYRAMAVTPFKEMVSGRADGFALKATHPGHLHGSHQPRDTLFGPAPVERDREAATSPNGNSVSLEREMLRSVDAKRQHDRALAIYRSSLNILRSSLGRG